MIVPDGAREVIRSLKAAGYEAYLVGGCVRDALLAASAPDIVIHDWDICTDAKPEEMKTVFAAQRTADTGLKHGTITVLMTDGQYEVTAYRIDGTYSDGRHPDSVVFTDSITEDLSRRDFTINAMAMDVDDGGAMTDVIDPFCGRRDLTAKTLRCVGEPGLRFEEDALRILRAIRFASRLGFEIEPATRDAMLAKRALLRCISAERVMDELGKILLTDRGWEYLLEYRDILTEILPEIRPSVDFEQKNPWHCHTVFDHILRSVGNAPKELTVRMTMLLHDIGKPISATTDEAGIVHFHGHAERSAEMAEQILNRFHCSNQLLHDVVELVRWHDVEVEPSEKALRRLLNKIGTEQAERLLQVKRADTLAQSDMARERKLPKLERCELLLEQVLAERQVFSLQDLAISGKDLLERGIAPGPEIGARLQRALDAVIDGTVENERGALLAIALDGERGKA